MSFCKNWSFHGSDTSMVFGTSFFSGGSEMRGDMPLWWISEAEDEVSSLPQEAYEYKAKQGSHSLSSSF